MFQGQDRRRQYVERKGSKRGLLRPESRYLCSSAFRKMVEDEKLKGFVFEVAHIE
jgi:hypothetical protein